MTHWDGNSKFICFRLTQRKLVEHTTPESLTIVVGAVF